MATQIKLRRDTAANWTSNNPVLAQGEPGYDLTSKRLKIGDGVTAWNTLAWFDDQATDLSAVSQNIVPDADNTRDLGSPTNRFRHLYVAPGTLYLGDVKLSNVAGKLVATKVINAGEENEYEDETDSNAFSNIGGGASTGDVTFSTNKILGTNNSLILKSEPDNEFNNLYGLELFNSIDNDTHLRPLDRTKGIALGFAYGFGSHIRVEGTNGQGGIPDSGDRVGIVATNGINNAEWIFDNDGKLSLPGGNQIYDDQGRLTLDGTLGDGYVEIKGSANSAVLIGANTNVGVQLGNNEAENTDQTVSILSPKLRLAYQAVPTTSKGVLGDIQGMVAFDSTYMYYCALNYTDGINDIWKRVAWSNDTW